MICLIPLRSSSKRLKDKNIKLIDDRPCFAYVLETAHRSGIFDKIIIAVDPEYEEIAKNNIPLGTILYVRDSQNSRDESPLIDLLREVVDFYLINDKSACILYSTSVLTTEDQLKRSYKILREVKYKCVFPVVRQENELFIDDYGANKNDCDYCLDDIAKHADSFFMFDIKTVNIAC